jgi:carbamoyltransferase
MLYSTFTAYLGFAVNEDEYKVMGLAGFGRPTMVDQVRKVIERTPDGAFRLDLDYFEFHTTTERSYSKRFVELFGPPRNSYQPIDLDTAEGQRFADCAASVQRVLEDTLVDMARALRQETGLTDLCLGGGVALNGVANARILAESGFERVFVPSAPGDAGCALGAALYADRIHFGNPDREVPDHPFWGPPVDGVELARLAREDGHPFEELDDSILIERTADDLAADRVIGWMDGALELGPRALGHRSILAAPHARAMRDRLNRDIKFREEFRPFAPVVPIESADRYFELPPGGSRLARFMSGVFPVRPEWRARLAAVTHVDGTARLQTLSRDMAPRLYKLLEAYGQRTGIPVLLNTSFNLAGEPIVNRVVEGYTTFKRSGMDVLVAGQTRLAKRASALAKPIEEVTCSRSVERSSAS